MQKNDIESELSYAYLHAVAAKAGMSCKPGTRLDDNVGDDAYINYRGPLNHPYLRQIQLNIQLKATFQSAGKYPDHFSYFFEGTAKYENMRVRDGLNHRFLVVLFLPPDANEWLSCSADQLILKRAAYWVCLYGANPCTNVSGETIYLPKANLLTPAALNELVEHSANDTIPKYQKP